MTNADPAFSLLLSVDDDTSDGFQGARLHLLLEVPCSQAVWLSFATQGVVGLPTAMHDGILSALRTDLEALDNGEGNDAWGNDGGIEFALQSATLVAAVRAALETGEGAEVRSARSTGVYTQAVGPRWVLEIDLPLEEV